MPAKINLESESQTLKLETYVETDYPENLRHHNLDWREIEALPWQQWFQVWLENLISHLPIADSYELSLRLTSDQEIQILNQRYRLQDQPTDVLAFAALENTIPQPEDIIEPLYLGDIIISLDTANKQARSQQHHLSRELAFLATHGLLHLLGWDHPHELSLSQMLSKQADLLTLVGID